MQDRLSNEYFLLFFKRLLHQTTKECLLRLRKDDLLELLDKIMHLVFEETRKDSRQHSRLAINRKKEDLVRLISEKYGEYLILQLAKQHEQVHRHLSKSLAFLHRQEQEHPLVREIPLSKTLVAMGEMMKLRNVQLPPGATDILDYEGPPPKDDPQGCICEQSSYLMFMLQERRDTEGKQRLVKCINAFCGRTFHLACVLQDPESNHLQVSEQEILEWECMFCYLLRMDPTRKTESVLVPAFISQASNLHYYRLSEEQLAAIQKDNWQVELRSVRVKRGIMYEITYPDYLTVFVNNQQILRVEPIKKNSSIKKRKDLLANVYYNTLFNVLESQGSNSTYEVTSLHKELRLDPQATHLISLVLTSPRQDYVDRLLASSATYEARCLARLQQQFVASDVQLSQLNVSLIDEMYLTLIDIPGRGRLCNHAKVFSIPNFLEANKGQNNGKMRCPICFKRAYDLQVDQFIYQRLQQWRLSTPDVDTRLFSKVELVLLEDGSHQIHFQEEEEQPDSDSESPAKAQSKPCPERKDSWHYAPPDDRGQVVIVIDDEEDQTGVQNLISNPFQVQHGVPREEQKQEKPPSKQKHEQGQKQPKKRQKSMDYSEEVLKKAEKAWVEELGRSTPLKEERKKLRERQEQEEAPQDKATEQIQPYDLSSRSAPQAFPLVPIQHEAVFESDQMSQIKKSNIIQNQHQQFVQLQQHLQFLQAQQQQLAYQPMMYPPVMNHPMQPPAQAPTQEETQPPKKTYTVYLNQKNYSKLIQEQQRNIVLMQPKKDEGEPLQDRLNKRIKGDQPKGWNGSQADPIQID